MSERDVKNQKHYTSAILEPIQAMYNMDKYIAGFNFSSYCLGNVLKYLVRYPNKNGMEDIRKARVYAEFLHNAGYNIDLKTPVLCDEVEGLTTDVDYDNISIAKDLCGDREHQILAVATVLQTMNGGASARILISCIDELIAKEKELGELQ